MRVLSGELWGEPVIWGLVLGLVALGIYLSQARLKSKKRRITNELEDLILANHRQAELDEPTYVHPSGARASLHPAGGRAWRVVGKSGQDWIVSLSFQETNLGVEGKALGPRFDKITVELVTFWGARWSDNRVPSEMIESLNAQCQIARTTYDPNKTLRSDMRLTLAHGFKPNRTAHAMKMWEKDLEVIWKALRES